MHLILDEGLGNNCFTTQRINRELCYPCSTGDDCTRTTTMQGCWYHLPAAAWRMLTSAPVSFLLPTSFLQRRGLLLMAVPVALVEFTRSLLWCSGTWHDRGAVSLSVPQHLTWKTQDTHCLANGEAIEEQKVVVQTIQSHFLLSMGKSYLWFLHLSIQALVEVSEHWVVSCS